MTIDGYIIDVRDRIGISQNFTVAAADVTAEPTLAAVGIGGAINYLHQRLRYIDQGHRLRRHVARSRVRWQHVLRPGLQLRQVEGDIFDPGMISLGRASMSPILHQTIVRPCRELEPWCLLHQCT